MAKDENRCRDEYQSSASISGGAKMNQIICTAAMAAFVITGLASEAHASKLCNLTGVFTDEYGLATATIKGKKGSLVAPPFCNSPYTFRITHETTTGFDVAGKSTDKSCGKFTASPTFMGSCSVFGGTVTIKGQMLSDTFTKQAAAHVAPPASSLTTGMR
jgi:hypothetical protein